MLSPFRLTVVCLSSVTFVHHAQPVEIFGNFSSLFGTMAINWHSRKILLRSSQGTHPPGGGLNARGVAKYSDFSPLECCISIGTKIGDLEWLWTAKWPLFCVILPNLGVSWAHCVKVVDKAIIMDNLRLLCQVVKVCRGTARRLRINS